jgi:hypothetical protein
LSDQKLVSARRKSGRQPNQPTATAANSTTTVQKPSSGEATLSVIALNHMVVAIGTRPSRIPGTTRRRPQAMISLGRLISTSMPPASASMERFLVLEASSSMSPWRGSMIGCIIT